MHKRKIVIITTGQPATNPRSVKEAISLSSIYNITFIYKYWVDWALTYDKKIIEENPDIDWILVGGSPFVNKWKYYFTRLRHKSFRLLNKFFPKNIFIAKNAAIRSFNDIVKSACQHKADLYIAHNLGALPAAAVAAKKNHAQYAFDAEDYYRGQEIKGSIEQNNAILLEDKYLPGASYITAASPLIEEKYKKLYRREVFVINNAFSKKYLARNINESTKPIKLFWFSQTIGTGRGIEDVILALKEMPEGAFSLTLLGKHDDAIKNEFINMAKNEIYNVQINFIEPVLLDRIFQIAAEHDIGLALETGRDENNGIALSNKIFTYLLAGNAIIFSDTKAQRKFYEENKEVGVIYECGNIAALKKILVEFRENFSKLNAFKMDARAAAATKYNWEIGKNRLLKIIETTLQV
jgi:glycosyltransferase involved in cell wall biosynthesis